jgi:hypothetical protein
MVLLKNYARLRRGANAAYVKEALTREGRAFSSCQLAANYFAVITK